MKPNLLVTSFIAATCLVAASLRAGTAEEKAFLDKFKTAFEAGDKTTLESFLYNANEVGTAVEDSTVREAFLEKKGEQVSLKPTKILLYRCTSFAGGVQWNLALKDGKFVIPVPVPVK